MSDIDKKFEELYKYANSKIGKMKKKLDNEIEKELHNLGKETVKKIKEYINYWYSSYQPEDYDRTYDLFNSVSYSVKNKTVKIFFDMRKFHTANVNGGVGWQPHKGFDGEKFTWGLIDWIENGDYNGGSEYNPRRYDGGIHMIENTKKWINEYLEKRSKEIVRVVFRETR